MPANLGTTRRPRSAICGCAWHCAPQCVSQCCLEQSHTSWMTIIIISSQHFRQKSGTSTGVFRRLADKRSKTQVMPPTYAEPPALCGVSDGAPSRRAAPPPPPPPSAPLRDCHPRRISRDILATPPSRPRPPLSWLAPQADQVPRTQIAAHPCTQSHPLCAEPLTARHPATRRPARPARHLHHCKTATIISR